MTALTDAMVAGFAAASPALGADSPPITSYPSFQLDFEETAGAGHYDKSAPIPPGWGVGGMKAHYDALFDATTSVLRAGDTGMATRYLNDVNLADDSPFANGVGPYNLAAGQGPCFSVGGAGDADMKDAHGDPFWPFYADGDTFSARLTTTGAGGGTGRLSLVVELVPLPSTALLAVKTPA